MAAFYIPQVSPPRYYWFTFLEKVLCFGPYYTAYSVYPLPVGIPLYPALFQGKFKTHVRDSSVSEFNAQHLFSSIATLSPGKPLIFLQPGGLQI